MKNGKQFRVVALGATLFTCLAFAGWYFSGQLFGEAPDGHFENRNPGGQACEAQDEWFVDSGPKQPDPNKDFPSSCAFHQWSWQSFLWLTQPEGNALRFMNFA